MATIANVIEWHVEIAACPGEAASGDQYLVREFPQGVLVGVLDGLGHGEEASRAARAAIEVLERNPQDSLISLVEQCHTALRLTRGAVLSLACLRIPESTLTWIGVGNVQGVLVRRDADRAPRQESLSARSGVVGSHLPQLRASIVPVLSGDLLILATDGIQSRFAEYLRLDDGPERIARRIMAECSRTNDDALVLVVRFTHGRDKRQAGSTGK